jgi:hypothetical protein
VDIIKNKKCLVALFIGSTLFLNGCTNAPNSITMTSNQGVCVLASMYDSKVTPPPAIVNNPTSAPYCIGITIQNNNSGTNANNVQILNTGLVVSAAGTASGGILYDPVAAQITVGNQNQSYGNMGIYDPKNCVTNQGANVTTLGVGQSCTFFLQLSAESNPVGVYPSSLTYNYTNGNQNYSISTTLNQRVYLYGGATSGLVYISTNLLTSTTPPAWQTGLTATAANVPYIMKDNFGFVYFATANTVYIYSGVNGASATQLGGTLPNNVIAVAIDANNNVYAATAGSGIYVYNRGASATPSWISLSGQLPGSSNLIGLQGVKFGSGQPNQLYATTLTNAYLCNNLNITSASASATCAIINAPPGPNVPTTFVANAMSVDQAGNLYTGSNLKISQFSNTWQIPYTTPTITGNVSGVNWAAQVNFPAPKPPIPATLYTSEINAPSNENSVFNCNLINSTCAILVSIKGGSISGNANSITTDGAGNVCVTGSGLTSADFAGTSVTGACMLNGSTPTASAWIPIQTGNLGSAPVSYGVIASMLTSY